MSRGIGTLSRRLRSAAMQLRGFRVPWCVPAWGWAEARASISAALTGRLVRGAAPEQFATAVASHLGMRHGVAVNRGRTAIEIGLRAMGIGRGDDVVLPAYACATLLEGVVASGATPVFADIGSDLNVTVATIAAALTPATRCVVVPHLFGKAAPIDEIETQLAGTGIAILDDAAQSFGARRGARRIGSFGRAGVVAIGAGKSLAGPAGGVLVTNDPAVHARASEIASALPAESALAVARRLWVYWLWRRARRVTYPLMVIWRRLVREREDVHVASRMSNVDAEIGLAQLAQLDQHSAERRENTAALNTALGDMAKWSVTDSTADGTQVKYVLVLPPNGPTAEECMAALADAGIETQTGYAPCTVPGVPAPPLPATHSLWRRVVCLPTETRVSAPQLARLLVSRA